MAVPNTDYSGTVILPADFLRLFSFKMTAWTKEATNALHPSRDVVKYTLQQNKWTRGSKTKPVVAVNYKKNTLLDQVLEYYSLESGDAFTIDYLRYIPFVDAENVQEDLQDALTWICAAKVMQTRSNSAFADMAFANASISYTNMY